MKNGMWLYLLQLFNTLLPLLTIPYLTRILGASVYGSFSFSLNIIGYFQVIVEYGFNLTGSRKIATAKNKEEIEKIYSAITTSKIILCIITFVLMIIISSIFNINQTQFISMIILYILVIGTSLQQTWLFQGIQDMKYITIINVIARTFSLIFIFLFVKNPNDLYVYCAVYSITFLINGIISTIIIAKKLKIKYKIPNFFEVKNEFNEGWHIFTTSAMSRIFSTFSITILGFISTDSDVGIFAAMQKIPLIIVMLFAPIGVVIYPYVSKIYDESFDKGIKVVERIGKITLPFATLIAIVLIFYSKEVTNLVFGTEYVTYALLLIPLSSWMIMSILNNFLGIQIVVASGHQKEYSTAFKYSLIALVLFNIIFGLLWGVYGVAVANFIAELTLTIILVFIIKKIRINNSLKL
ncbi:flippase [Planococcus maritimus]|nr:flippase [Planococcus maritimus]